MKKKNFIKSLKCDTVIIIKQLQIITFIKFFFTTILHYTKLGRFDCDHSFHILSFYESSGIEVS